MRSVYFILWVLIAIYPSVAKADPQSCVLVFMKERAKQDSKSLTKSDAENMVYAVAQSIGLSGRLTVVPCTSERNASAWYAPQGLNKIPQGDYLVFNPTWVMQVTGDDKTQVIAILGHELGHLFNRDFTSQLNTQKRQQEAEADQFAGCAVAKMQGNWDALEGLLRRIRFANVPDYPTASESIAQARSGFEKCGGTYKDKTIGKLLLQYHGPDLTATASELSKDPASELRVLTDSTKRYYEYRVTVFDQQGVLRFFLTDGQVSEIALQAFSSTTRTETIKGEEESGEPGRAGLICNSYYPKVLSTLRRAFSENGRPYSSSEDRTSKLSYYKRFCRNETKYAECTKDASYSMNGVAFLPGAKVNIEQQSYNASLFEKDSFRGLHWETTWRNWYTDSCSVTLRIENPLFLRTWVASLSQR
ncbi:hypothetical protein [Rhizobium leguminosarum]|uniref:hypothetical protein n=1 Tax=Rhizobium leguminosarum TaxID=384 RepID=UPI0010301DE3|nr:hypothetical protein [Rhizobium leguminosarum]TAX36480.1 hypothetical protein ELI06_20175 [Rhizobium leguminosarum]